MTITVDFDQPIRVMLVSVLPHADVQKDTAFWFVPIYHVHRRSAAP
jgi:hypothetical protein